MARYSYYYRLGAFLLLGALVLVLTNSSRSYADEPSHYFRETGHTVSGLFLTYWNNHGGLAQFGYPVSEQFVEPSDLDRGKSYDVQYFERAVMERHPEYAGTPYEVLLSLLGTYRWRDKYQAAPTSGLLQCEDFTAFADDTVLGPKYTSPSGITYQQVGGSPMIAQQEAAGLGLRFPDQGVDITLPSPVSSVILKLLPLGATIRVVASDASGNVVFNQSIGGSSHLPQSLLISAPKIQRLSLSGGRNEALILEICVLAPAPPAPGVCVDFEPPLTLGTQYGTPAGQHSGDLAFTTNGIPVHVYNFSFTSGGSAFNLAKIDTAPAPFGNGQSIRTNNINLDLDFSGLGFQSTQVQLEYLDLGGFENLSVNGSPITAGELSAAPPLMGGVAVAVTTVPVSGGKKGTLTLKGAVKTLRIGGQEFWIDNVCVMQ